MTNSPDAAREMAEAVRLAKEIWTAHAEAIAEYDRRTAEIVARADSGEDGSFLSPDRKVLIFPADSGSTAHVGGVDYPGMACAPLGLLAPVELDREILARAVLAQAEQIERMRKALEKIEAWQDFPPTTDREGKPCSYAWNYGSNGERDFMRDIARAALRGSAR